MKFAGVVLLGAVAACVLVPVGMATGGTLSITTSTTLTEDHQGSIVVNGDNVTLDCAGHLVRGPGTVGQDAGITVSGRTGVTIKNCHVSGFLHGIGLLGASNTEVRGNVVTGQSGNGVFSTDGVNNSFRSNEVSANGAHGIIIGSSTGGSVLSNLLSGNGRGGLTILGLSSGHTVASNSASRNGWSGIIVIASSNNQVRDNRSDDNGQSGISLQGGVDGQDTNNNLLTGNVANGNAWFGIDLGYFSAVVSGDPTSAAFSNTLKGNVATKNALGGFAVFGDSSLNLLQDNRGRNNTNYDGLDASTGAGNTWANNSFATTSGI